MGSCKDTRRHERNRSTVIRFADPKPTFDVSGDVINVIRKAAAIAY